MTAAAAPDEVSDRTDAWFRGAGLGIFIHWDHASQQGLEISWPLVGGLSALPRCQSVPVSQYHSSAATFDPRGWEPDVLARMARGAGATYAVLTAKHHSGYAMFDTATSSFGVMSSPYGSDIVAGYAEAVRAAGLRVGIYFSLSDWSHPLYPPSGRSTSPIGRGPHPRPAPTGTGTVSCRTCSPRSASCSPTTGRSTCSGSTAAGSAPPGGGGRRS